MNVALNSDFDRLVAANENENLCMGIMAHEVICKRDITYFLLGTKLEKGDVN